MDSLRDICVFQDLSEQLAALEQAKTSLAESLKQSQAALDQKQQDLDQSKSDRDLLEQTLKKEIMDYRNSMLGKWQTGLDMALFVVCMAS